MEFGGRAGAVSSHECRDDPLASGCVSDVVGRQPGADLLIELRGCHVVLEMSMVLNIQRMILILI